MSGTNNPELVICRGLQASGKTTWARKWVAADRANRVRVNRDDLRQMFDAGAYEKNITEGRILMARDALVRQALLRGLSVVCDDTNLSAKNVKDLAKIAHFLNKPWRVEDFTFVPPETCIERDGLRHASVGHHVILDTYNRYLKGRKLPLPVPDPAELGGHADDQPEPYVPPAGKPPALIIDIDGTIALRGTRNPFDETRVIEDRPNSPVIDVIRADVIEFNLYPIFCSGRTSACFDATQAWIRQQFPEFVFFSLFMRPTEDFRKDSVVKLEIFNRHIRDHYQVRRVYDDRNQVVQMWRSLGLTVLQVADGNF